MKRIVVALAAALLASAAAHAAGPARSMDTSLGAVLADRNGMTLYVFDKDTKGAAMSACIDQCIANWPPFLAAEGAPADGAWTIVDVKDKDGAMKKMWARDGWPLYLFVKDTKAGDVTGDGVGGVWHVVKAESGETTRSRVFDPLPVGFADHPPPFRGRGRTGPRTLRRGGGPPPPAHLRAAPSIPASCMRLDPPPGRSTRPHARLQPAARARFRQAQASSHHPPS